MHRRIGRRMTCGVCVCGCRWDCALKVEVSRVTLKHNKSNGLRSKVPVMLHAARGDVGEWNVWNPFCKVRTSHRSVWLVPCVAHISRIRSSFFFSNNITGPMRCLCVRSHQTRFLFTNAFSTVHEEQLYLITNKLQERLLSLETNSQTQLIRIERHTHTRVEENVRLGRSDGRSFSLVYVSTSRTLWLNYGNKLTMAALAKGDGDEMYVLLLHKVTYIHIPTLFLYLSVSVKFIKIRSHWIVFKI